MIVTKTPLRISFFGGGSDLPQFYNKEPGLVVSTTINNNIFIAVNKTATPHTKVMYSEIEVVHDSMFLKHDRVREILQKFNIRNGIEVASFSDIPTKGTGLGSSSTFTVGLLKAMLELNNIKYNRYDLAEVACEIEIQNCNQPIGKQDQYAATFGGLNAIMFSKEGTTVVPINMPSINKKMLEDNLLCFNTGITRQASTVLSKQVKNLKSKNTFENTKSLVFMAEVAIQYLNQNRLNDFGDLLNESWNLKKKLSDNISNDTIDEMYETARNAGALGGKILGAGGGGYMLLYVPQHQQHKVVRALRRYEIFDFSFSDNGSTLELSK